MKGLQLVCFLVLCIFGNAQHSHIAVNYLLLETRPMEVEEKSYSPTILHFDYKAIYWDNQLFAYAILRELKDYPDGKIVRETGIPNHSFNNIFSTKPVQRFEWIDYDSAQIRRIADDVFLAEYDSCVGEHSLWKFGPNVEHWEYLEETKQINNLNCQRAKRYYPDGMLMWDVWFTPDINVPGSIFSMYNLPGLMVQAESPILSLKFDLQSIEMLDPNGPKPYLPPCVNDYFPYKGTMKTVQQRNQQ